MVKRSHGVNVHNLIQKIENHPQRQALQSDLLEHHALNLFSKESQDAIKAAGNIVLCEIVDVEPKAQCRACLTYWDVGDDTTENKKYIRKGPATRSQVREESRLQRIPHGKSTSKKVSKETLQKHSRSINP